MDLNFLFKILPLLLEGAKMTVLLTVLAIFFGSILGLISALFRLSRFKVLNGISWFYTWSIRGIPLIVQLFIWYFGLPSLGIELSAFTAGVCALSVCEGAYISEIIRGGITSINKGQNEAAFKSGTRRALPAMTAPRRLHHLIMSTTVLAYVLVAKAHRHIVYQLRHLKAPQLAVAAMLGDQGFVFSFAFTVSTLSTLSIWLHERISPSGTWPVTAAVIRAARRSLSNSMDCCISE